MDLETLKIKQRCDELLKRTWNCIKDDLARGNLKYDDLNKLLEYTFMKQFDDMFCKMKSSLEVSLSGIKYLYRAAGEETTSYKRLVPNMEHSRLNRFNPPGEVFIYMGICDTKEKIDTEFNLAEKTCLEEIRAVKGQRCSLCEFLVEKSATDKKVIDISIVDQYTDNELISQLGMITFNDKEYYGGNKESLKRNIENKKGAKYEIAEVLAKVYMKMISDNLFIPVTNAKNKEYEYSPFHAFANYFRSKGYAGIIYKSTVCNGGKNLVLFNVNDVKYKAGAMQHKVY